jgi:hypothetical protein
MAGASKVVVVRAGENTPASFVRSLYVTCAQQDESKIIALIRTLVSELPAPRDGYPKPGSRWTPTADIPSVIFICQVDSVIAPPSERQQWHVDAVGTSDAIVCWLPHGDESHQQMRDCFTQLVSQWGSSGKVFAGVPPSQHSWARLVTETAGIIMQESLEAVVGTALKHTAKGAVRTGAERNVPLMIWNTEAWALWYQSVVSVGNRLDGAKVEWSFRVGPGGVFVLFWAVHANIWVASEERNKSNEVVIARPDIASVIAYRPAADMLDTEIIMIKEFRR